MPSKGPTETWAAGSKAAAVRPDEVNREEKTASRCSNRGAQVKSATATATAGVPLVGLPPTSETKRGRG